MFKCIKFIKYRTDWCSCLVNNTDDKCDECLIEESIQGIEAVGDGRGKRSDENNDKFEGDKEEDMNCQRMSNKLFEEENIHGYPPDIIYSNDEYRKSFRNGNSNSYKHGINYKTYSNEKFQNEYMKNSSNNYNQMNYMKKGNNDNSYVYMNENKNYRQINSSNNNYSREHNSFYNGQYDYNGKPIYTNTNEDAGLWNRDSKVYGNYNNNIPISEKYNEKLGTVVENGNVKRKTLLFSNINDSNSKKVNKNFSLLELETKRDSDVKACIEYFNSLRKGKNDDIKMILENRNFKELNIPKEHLENGDFFKYVEYYKKHNLKDLIDKFNESDTNDKNKTQGYNGSNKSPSAVSNIENKDRDKDSGSSNGNKNGYDKHKNEVDGALDPNKKSNNENINVRTKKNKRSENALCEGNSDENGKEYHKKKKSKCDGDKKPTFYTINDLFD
ncbi:hypothetical protein, conserved [Plasmodium gonderi]|uniref:Uncharacterized protein n=1 Tax=Plasmodium gonderi TaxID=77519 RepID=A0A1Y1JSQ9_PLAGO|nr:hypothetical protein, conserved [Plasmodium gonderi]GAW83453.1 hypothetical protein, conserved [Plasmodium gonderi]